MTGGGFLRTGTTRAGESANGDLHPWQRDPNRTAVLAVVTLTVYGFWWWWDLNRRLGRLGTGTRPWRALAAVTIGWVAIVPPFWSVHKTVAGIAWVQRDGGQTPSARPRTAVGMAAVAAVGLALFATAGVFPPSFFLFGWIPPVVGVLFIRYVQREYNRAVERPAASGPGPIEEVRLGSHRVGRPRRVA